MGLLIVVVVVLARGLVDQASELIGSVGYGFGVKTEPTTLREFMNQNDHWKPLPK